MQTFDEKLCGVLSRIDPAKLTYNEAEARFYEEDFARIDARAKANGLINTAIALRAVRALHDGLYRGEAVLADGIHVPKPYFCHCLSVCRMLINLPITLRSEDEDLLLAAALCHDVPAFVPETRCDDRLTKVYHLDPAVTELVELIYTRDCVTEADFAALFERVSGHPLALLIKLADRGHVVEGLHNVSVWRANEYIQETRTYYLPMCIYARENYPAYERGLGVLQEKLHDLIEAAEIFMMRYADLERELMTQILQLEEENAQMRTMIRKAGR